MRKYVPERETYSIDILTHSSTQAACHSVLLDHAVGHDTYAGTHHFYILEKGCLPVSVISIDEPWVIPALCAAQSNFDEHSLEPVLPFPYLVLSKLSYGKRQDFMDVARLLARASQQEAHDTTKLVQTWLPNEVSTIQLLHEVGTQEYHQVVNKKLSYVNEPNRYSPWYHLVAPLWRHRDTDWRIWLDSDAFQIGEDWPECMVSESRYNTY